MIAILNRQKLIDFKFGLGKVGYNGLRAYYKQISPKLFEYTIYDPTGVELTKGLVFQDIRFKTPDDAVRSRLEIYSNSRKMGSIIC